MKILLVHNHYGSEAPSGENEALRMERALLEARGHDVLAYERHSDALRAQGTWGKIRGALSTPWNPASAIDILRLKDNFRPDVMHVHNTFPLISPSVFSVSRGVARVLTLHNYRIFCAAGIPMRDGNVCTLCLDKRSASPALLHGCYRGSRIATAPLVASVALHRLLGTWQMQVDAFITLTEFQRDLLVASGLPKDRLHVKPNFYPGQPAVLPWHERDPCVVFAGRLSSEKGVESLIEAWKNWGPGAPELRIAGDGELRAKLETQAAGVPVRFLGRLSSTQAQEQIARSRLLILPSECFEGFPMVLREAFAFGTPAAVSDLGPLPALIRHKENGIVFPAANPGRLLHAVREAWESPGLLARLGAGARNEFDGKYNEENNYRELMSIYERAITASKSHPNERS